MPTQKKSIALIGTVASNLLLAACAPHQPAPDAADHPPMVVAEVSPPSAADLYAQRYPSSFAQVATGGKHRFVSCDPLCPGATPKTPLSSLNAAVAKRAQQTVLAEKALASTTANIDSDGNKSNDPGER
ncbi:MAG: hypothetical protein R3268_02520 [Acidiferrobacterales bacterium]|nr:hypothetical protein [Acidiferrobacterales bacterium]